MRGNPRLRILILILLLTAALSIWYTLFTQTRPELAAPPVPSPPPAPAGEPPSANPSPTTPAATKPLEVLPVPFLITEAPEEAPLETSAPESETIVLGSTEVPPNPFVPLQVEEPAQAQLVARRGPPAPPAPVPTDNTPIPITPPEEARPPSIPLPKVVLPQGGSAAPVPEPLLGQGSLPIRLHPLERELNRAAPLAEAMPAVVPPTDPTTDLQLSLGAVGLEPIADTPPEPLDVPTEAAQPENPLLEWAAAQELTLEGVALGPVGIAILKSAYGYLTVPVGQPIPGTDILVKTVTAERVLLVQGPYTLTLEHGGGE